MGPVSFQQVAIGLERAELLRAAGLLADAGIRAQLVDRPAATGPPGGVDDQPTAALLVRSEDVERARLVLETARE